MVSKLPHKGSPSSPGAALVRLPSLEDILELFPTIPPSAVPAVLLFYVAYIACTILNHLPRSLVANLFVPTVLVALNAYTTLRRTHGGRGQITAHFTMQLQQTTTRTVRSLVTRYYPDILRMSLHDFMTDGSFMETYGVLALYLFGLSEVELNQVLGRLAERDRNTLLQRGGVGRILGLDWVNDYDVAAQGGGDGGGVIEVGGGGGEPDLYMSGDEGLIVTEIAHDAETPVHTRRGIAIEEGRREEGLYVRTAEFEQDAETPVNVGRIGQANVLALEAETPHNMPAAGSVGSDHDRLDSGDNSSGPVDVLNRFVLPIIVPRSREMINEMAGTVANSASTAIIDTMEGLTGSVYRIGWGTLAFGSLDVFVSLGSRSISGYLDYASSVITATFASEALSITGRMVRARRGTVNIWAVGLMGIGIGITVSWKWSLDSMKKIRKRFQSETT